MFIFYFVLIFVDLYNVPTFIDVILLKKYCIFASFLKTFFKHVLQYTLLRRPMLIRETDIITYKRRLLDIHNLIIGYASYIRNVQKTFFDIYNIQKVSFRHPNPQNTSDIRNVQRKFLLKHMQHTKDVF